MFFINLNKILNSVDCTLEKNFISYNNSIVDNFIDELKSYLDIIEAKKVLNDVPNNTLFTLDRYEGNFAICENRTTGKMFDIPNCMIDSMAKDGDILKFDNYFFSILHKQNFSHNNHIKSLFDSLKVD